MQDMLGITKEFKPRFLRRYADLSTIVTDAVSHYVSDVKAKDFPNTQEKY
jgi:3-methyl-2-oxobutanoate hydroxymethyltransferase